jgi:hypothetical protein
MSLSFLSPFVNPVVEWSKQYKRKWQVIIFGKPQQISAAMFFQQQD